ncbi:XRE family transcriptional regulator [Deltaproteobacteria bacterium Smac51]|nr:XRE family transcriptional regulator [Deltaproteobacteria bacterium Smac51]
MPIAKRTYTEEEKEFVRNIGFRIQYFRKKAGLTQFQLAELVDLSEATIGQLESRNVYGLSIVALYRIAKVLSVEPFQLLQFD